ncbi:MAG TPA: hypothetical protein VK784_16700 [Pseudonocardiaceae bacterium]|nr:hypothetical protein [Pseudonocardiaceae bacterium]
MGFCFAVHAGGRVRALAPPPPGQPAATAGIMAVLMLGLHGGPSITRTVTIYAFFGYCLLVIAAILALRLLVTVFRPGTR